MLDQKQQSNSFEERVETIKQGGAPKYHEQNKAKGLPCCCRKYRPQQRPG